jgi:nicotinate-nucleotide pyrophosphorylase (carboxylating)
MSSTLDASAYHNILRSFLAEDIGAGDVTTETVVPPAQRAHGELIAKAPLVLAGIDLFVEVFRLLDPLTAAEIHFHDGAELALGQIPVRVTATARALLAGERVALNILQRLSGVATLTRRFVRAVAGTSAQIVDTRKTTPGLRDLEKYAVCAGGGHNHRMGLGDAVLIKENHIRLAGGVGRALEAVQTAKGRARWIEIEVTNFDELRVALAYSPDIIMLDNMDPLMVRQAVEQVRLHNPARKILTEASGGITLNNVRDFAEAGVDWISVGALTHSAPAVDLSFEIEPAR